MKTDNTVISNGIIKNNRFYPKKNLPSGTLRIVLTTDCNYQCKYCFAEGEINKEKRILNIEELKRIIKVSKEFGITNIKLTGGEPLLYPHIDELLSYIRKIDIPYIDLTTNISCLTPKNIKMLNKYNINALTLSLNTLKEEKFKYLSNFKNYDLMINNLESTIKNFKGSIRINCIIFDDRYEQEDYDEIVQFCKTRKLGLRLVEPSEVEGLEITYTKEKFEEYIKIIKSTANKVIASNCESVEYVFFDDWYLTIMHSLCDNRFCDSCTDYMYIRVTSEMKLKPCLSRRDTEVPINMENDETIKMSFIEAIEYMGVGIKNEVS